MSARTLITAAVASFALTVVVAAPAAATYRLVDLGPASDFRPYAIGEDATIVGTTTNNAATPVVWRNGAFRPLPGPGRCQAFDINADGKIAGACSDVSAYGSVPVVWSFPPGGDIGPAQRLPGLDAEGSGAATTLASDGSVGGTILERMVPNTGLQPYKRAVIWSKSGAIRRLDGAEFSVPEYADVSGLNAVGTVVGSRDGTFPGRRWTVSGSTVTRVDEDPYTTSGTGQGHPINDGGEIAGIRRGDGSGIIRLNDGAIVETGTFHPQAINQVGVTVGLRDGKGALRRIEGTVVELSTLVPQPAAMDTFAPQDINERGDITGSASVGGIRHGFVLLNETVDRLEVGLEAGTIGSNDIFDLRLSVRHSGEAGTPDIGSLAFPPGNGIVQTAGVFGTGSAPTLVPIFGPVPGYPDKLIPGQRSEHTLSYAVETPGVTLLQTRVTGRDSAGDEHVGAAGVKVEASYKQPSRQDLDGLVAGSLGVLMDQAVTKRAELAAKLSDLVRRKLRSGKGGKALLTPTPFERALATGMNLPANALSWLPDRQTATGQGSARKPSGREVALAMVQATGGEMLKVGDEAIDRTVRVPFAFWRDYLFQPGDGDRARLNLELAGVVRDGYEGTKGILGNAAEFYSHPAQMQAAWTALPQMTEEASQELKQLDIKTSNAIVEWDDLMRTDPVKGAQMFGKLLGRIEGEVAVGWLENFTGEKASKGLKAFARARAASGIKSEVSEVVGTTSRLSGAGATPLAKTRSLGNLNEKQLDRFQQIVKSLSDKFGVDLELQARPINEFAAKVKGGIGKVEALPTKNLTPDDMLLGAPQEYLAQTAYYHPVLPKNFGKLAKDVQERLSLRAAEKAKEFKQFLGKVADPTGKAAKVRKALEPGGSEFVLGKNGKLVMELEQTTHKSGAVLIRYKKLVVNGKPVFTGAPRSIISDVDFNALVVAKTGKALPAGIRGQAELTLMDEFRKAAEDGIFPFGFHGFTHSGFDVAAKDFRYILKYQLMYMSDEQAAKLAAKFARIYGTTPQEFLEGYTKGKLLVKITASGSTLGPGS